MSKRRLLRVADLLREELSDIIRRGVHDPRVMERDFTVTRVVVSPDLYRAKVGISSLLPPADRDAMIAGLQHASGFIHRELMHRVRLKNVPSLTFEYDGGLESSQHIADLLQAIKRGAA